MFYVQICSLEGECVYMFLYVCVHVSVCVCLPACMFGCSGFVK